MDAFQASEAENETSTKEVTFETTLDEASPFFVAAQATASESLSVTVGSLSAASNSPRSPKFVSGGCFNMILSFPSKIQVSSVT